MKKKVVCIANQKGGVGKSTIATNLAIVFAALGKKIMIVDADPQGTSTRFYAERQEAKGAEHAVSCVSITTPTLHTVLDDLNFDICIIDVGGKNDVVESNAMRVSDLIIIPMQMSKADVWATEVTLAKVASLLQIAPEKKARILYNQCNPLVKTKIQKEIQETETEIEEQYGVYFFSSYLHMREAYKKTLGSGLSVVEEMGDEKAQYEINTLADEIITILGDKL